ncbi:hypothetical protein HZC32_00200 [Candidatus Woesearchaeota archaeon]|nr:hypothetical protein [Candidatus Woesearchaeota archaeon]
MRIAVCGSMTFCQRMVEVEQELKQLGHEVILPEFTHDYAKLDTDEHRHNESFKNKIQHNLIPKYFEKIKLCDAILVINESRHNIENYIGGNSFLEMGFAHILNKKIFVMNPLPEMLYGDELQAMQPIVIEKNFDLIK